MIKIAEIWGLGFDKLAKELEVSTVGVTGIVLDFLCEIYYKLEHSSFYKILDIAHENNISITILTPYIRSNSPLLDFKNPKYKNIKMIYWETFWFNRTYNVWKPHIEYNKQKNLDIDNVRNAEHLTDFKYPYITLNNISKNHRCLIMDLLAKHNLIERGAIAWRDIRRNCDEIRHTFPEGMTDSEFCNYPYKYWKPKRLILDQDINDRFLQETMPLEFNQSFMQLVTESDDEVIFFSEKTATPLLLNKIFLIAGAPYIHEVLKTFGFELYDELFDYRFDSIKDNNDRFEGLIDNVKRISSMSNQELCTAYKKIYDKVVYNKTVALNLSNTLPDDVIKVLEMFRQENKDPYSGPLNMFL